MDKELKDFLDKKFSQVDGKFDQFDKRFDDIDKRLIRTDERIDQKTEDVLHRFQIIAENLGDKIKQVAEGVVNLNEKMDRRFDEMNKKYGSKTPRYLCCN